MTRLEVTARMYVESDIDFIVCGNAECYYFGDTTPTNGPHSNQCIFCNMSQVHVSTLLIEEVTCNSKS